jgi:hypothetical protein
MNADQLSALTNALSKLEQIIEENRAYLLTPVEAAALQRYIKRHGIAGEWLMKVTARKKAADGHQGQAGKVRP